MQSSYLDCSNCKKLGHEIETMKEQLREREEKLKILLQQLNENMSKAKKDRLALENGSQLIAASMSVHVRTKQQLLNTFRGNSQCLRRGNKH